MAGHVRPRVLVASRIGGSVGCYVHGSVGQRIEGLGFPWESENLKHVWNCPQYMISDLKIKDRPCRKLRGPPGRVTSSGLLVQDFYVLLIE